MNTSNHLLSVQQISALTPHVVRVIFKSHHTFHIEANWIGPHLKLLFPKPNSQQIVFPSLNEKGKVIWQGDDRKQVRTYSVRDYDHQTNTLTVDFVIHQQGTAMNWLKQANIGDNIGLIKLSSKTQYDESKHIVLLGDIAAMPAICYTLEHAPKHQKITAIMAIHSEDDKQNIQATTNNFDIHWLISTIDSPNQFIDILSTLPINSDHKPLYFWGGMETSIVQQVRHYLKNRFTDLSGSEIQLMSYWRKGFAEGEFKHSD